ncbi:dimethylsulfonioproprionate lyase family protein [Dongia rigui]|uniref:Dimethylsulfonioproprionate lyase family protein n=1 Tax=Dongia rigui TaxID=940149 RepID=A0ABU5E3K5_9PROT|nr:dimethylsulfonioproprionate lyase family protein [Dongia rigui]MDY0873770.1 dimethylsulfonioproprionate lyase family protein [Dongia rigui]
MTSSETLWLEIDRFLATLDPAHAGVASVRARMREMTDIRSRSLLRPANAPLCGYLEEALAAIETERAIPLQQALRHAPLHWESYRGYVADTIGPHFPKRHAYASLMVGADPDWACDFDLGLFLITPGTLYRDHHHLAPELYVPLTGPSKWRFGAGKDWAEKPAGAIVWNPPNQVHATLVGTVPFLCLYAWTEAVHVPAKVDFSEDWNALEAVG